MTIAISFDPNDPADVEFVNSLLAAGDAPAPAPKKAAAKKTAAKADPEPEPEEAEEETEAESNGPTLEQAVERATELVSEGRAADVKGALAKFNVRRVSELAEDQVAEFLEIINEESVV